MGTINTDEKSALGGSGVLIFRDTRTHRELDRRYIGGEEKMIIAVDFDGVLVEDQFPEIGPPKEEMVGLVKHVIAAGHEAVLWTSRTDARLAEAVVWCIAHGLRFSAINDQAPSNKAKYQHLYPNGTRKVYADLYIDDHNMGYDEETVKREIRKLLGEELTWKNWKRKEEN